MATNWAANEPHAQALRELKERTPNLRKVLRRCDPVIGWTTFDDWINERSPVPCWAGPALYEATGDMRFLSAWVRCSDIGVTLSKSQSPACPTDVLMAALRAHGSSGRASDAITKALEDGVITSAELALIIVTHEDAQRDRAAVVEAATRFANKAGAA